MEPIKVIIVEDDPMVLKINREYIEKINDFIVEATATTGKAALKLIAQTKPDLVILDIYLPDMNGVSVLQNMRLNQMPTDVILVTAARDSETIQSVFRSGAIDYIIKPFKMERLQSALESYKLLYARLQKKDSLDQEALDSLKTASRITGHEPLPKGLNDVTLRQIFLFMLKDKESMSAEEVAEGVGLARVTARRYLDHLEKTGKLKLEVQYGSVGRPINRYKIL